MLGVSLPLRQAATEKSFPSEATREEGGQKETCHEKDALNGQAEELE